MTEKKKLSDLFQDFERAAQINRENLKIILRDNKDTDYGREMGFSGIDSPEKYARRVPLTVYEDYNGLCEPLRYTAYPTRYTVATSGSTGERKVFPLTEEALGRYGSHVYNMLYHHFDGREGPHFHTGVFRVKDNRNILLSEACYRTYKERGDLDPSSFVGGERLLFADDITDVFYVKAWLMLCCLDIVSIQSIFLYDVLLVTRYLEENWRAVLADMRAKRVGAALGDEVKRRLLACLPDDSSLDDAENILSEGFDAPILPRLYKNLRFISGIGGKSMEFQTKALSCYRGNIPLVYETYSSSECMMGIAPRPERAEYMFLPYNAYYEFMAEDGSFTQFEEVEAGGYYEPVITTFGGLYRYRTGDMIKILDVSKYGPLFEVHGRKQTMNIAGEKLNVQLVENILTAWANERHIVLSDFAVGVEQSLPSRYWVFLETMGDVPADSGSVLDGMFGQASADYTDIRRQEMLRELSVRVCPSGSINKVFGEGHSKHHTFLKETQTNALLRMDND